MTKSSSCRMILVFILILVFTSLKGQSVSGTAGLFHIPSAIMFPEKTFIIGASYIPMPYFQRFGKRRNPGMPTYLNITLFPFMEVMFRYTHELNMRVNPTTRYYPDRMMTFRFKVLKEKKWIPAIVFGFQDITKALGLSSESANNYSASYIVGTKGFKISALNINSTLGFAYNLKNLPSEDYKGIFGGIEVTHKSLPLTSFMLEHNSKQPIVGIRHFFINRFQLMLGVWGFNKMTMNLSYRVNL